MMHNAMRGLQGAMSPEQDMHDTEGGDTSPAQSLLDEAITLHQGHMDGTEPVDGASQAQLMQLLLAARDAISSPGLM